MPPKIKISEILFSQDVPKLGVLYG